MNLPIDNAYLCMKGKSDVIKVRVEPDLKDAFMYACELDQENASSAIRRFLIEYIEKRFSGVIKNNLIDKVYLEKLLMKTKNMDDNIQRDLFEEPK